MNPNDSPRLIPWHEFPEIVWELAGRSWPGRLAYLLKKAPTIRRTLNYLRHNEDAQKEKETLRFFQSFAPIDDRRKKRWSGFTSAYYGWNPTWNYEFPGDVTLQNYMFAEHIDRLLNKELKNISYLLPPVDSLVSPLKVGKRPDGKEWISVFFEELKKRVDENLGMASFADNITKYKIYQLSSEHIPEHEHTHKVLNLGTSTFIGRHEAKFTVLLFINSPPHMSSAGMHHEAYFTYNSQFYKLLRDRFTDYMAKCNDDHQKGKKCVYVVNEDGNLEVAPLD